MHGLGHTDRVLSSDEAASIVREALAGWELGSERVLVIVPDGTRSGPVPLMFRLICEELADQAAVLDFLIALGTHQPMTEEQIENHLGASLTERKALGVRVFNHEWWDPEMLVSLGTISKEEVEHISGGLLRHYVEVRVNRHLTEYDRVIVCGPVFPHEVVGFSGGNKYFFPGVSGPEVIDLSHWLGTLITNYEIIGRRGTTPVRRLIDRAASLISAQRLCIAMVVGADSGELR